MDHKVIHNHNLILDQIIQMDFKIQDKWEWLNQLLEDQYLIIIQEIVQDNINNISKELIIIYQNKIYLVYNHFHLKNNQFKHN